MACGANLLAPDDTRKRPLASTVHNATSLSTWTRALKQTLDQSGVDGSALLLQAGLSEQALADPNARFPLENTTRLWRLAVAATGNAALGLDVSRNINQTTFHALGYSVLASPTLAACFERLLRYFRIVSDAGDLGFSCENGICRFSIEPITGESKPADEAVDAMLAVIYRTCIILTARQFKALRVTLRRPAPDAAALAVFEQVFKAPLEFSAEQTAIWMSADCVQEPLPAGNAELAQHNDAILTQYLAHFEKQNVGNRVHAVLVEQLPNGVPTQDSVAAHLHMSTRNLQRKLQAEGSSFKDILNTTREKLARAYVADSRYSISEVAYLLGFADTSSFTRAFRRWAGVAPRQYRQDETPG